MNKYLSVICLLTFWSQVVSQSTRVCLYESFCGENCPPCAATNPMLNALLSSSVNAPHVICISWETPIPSAPTNTFSLYQTNKTEHDWRYKNVGGYGYNISSVPNGRMDGQYATQFGASSNHPGVLNNTVIATAQSYTTPFSISINKVWDATYSTIYASIGITATSGFTATGNLVFRLVMIEREVHFQVPTGTNGEKDFYNVAVRSYPTLQSGTPMTGTWTAGQSQNILLACPLPSYVRDKTEIALVGFIQDDGNRKVWQTGFSEKSKFPNDAKALSVTVPQFVCSSQLTPTLEIQNYGNNAITALTITPYIDNSPLPPLYLSTNIGVAASTTLTLGPFYAPLASGVHSFSYTISGVSGGDLFMENNSKSTSFVVLPSKPPQNPIAEGFGGSFPPSNWSLWNTNYSPGWVKVNGIGGFQNSIECTKVNLYTRPAGEINELILPPIDLQGVSTPSISFDISYRQYNTYSNDALSVEVSYDCGDTWAQVYAKAGFSLSTLAPSTSNFVPTLSNDWRRETVALTGYNLSSVLVKFKLVTGNGNNLYLDNVNLSQSNPVSLKEYEQVNPAMSIYPNPGSEETFVSITCLKEVEAKLVLVNPLGERIHERTIRLDAGSNILQLNISGYVAGVYQIMLETTSGSFVKKFLLNK